MEGLDVSKLPIDLILNILNIVLLFLITKKLVYKPVKNFLNARTERVAAAKAEAEQAKCEAEQAKAEYTAKFETAAEDGRRSADELVKNARKTSDEMIDEAKGLADKIITEAELHGEAEKNAILADAKSSVIDMSFAISEKLLERNITDDDNRRLAEKLFDAVTEN